MCADLVTLSARRRHTPVTVSRARSRDAGVPPPAAAAPPGRRGLARPDPAPGPLRPGRGHDHDGGIPPPAAADRGGRDRAAVLAGGGGRRRSRAPAGPVPARAWLAHRGRRHPRGRGHEQGRSCADQSRRAARRRRAGRRAQARYRRRVDGRGLCPGRRSVRAGAAQHGDARAARLASRRRPGDRAEDPRLPPEARRLPVGRRARRRARDRSEAARPAARAGRSVSVLDRSPHSYAAAICFGLAGANLIRGSTAVALVFCAGLGVAALGRESPPFLLLLALVVLGWWWGSARLDALDRSVLLGHVDTSERSVLAVTGPTRRSRFELRVPAQVRRFGRIGFREAVLLELPLGRSPPQGALIETVVTVRRPKPPKNGFDETTWLRRHGVHVVLRADRWRQIGRRGGLGGVADRLRRALAGSITPGIHGERRGIVEGVVLGDEQSLSDGLRRRFRASGLYHLLSQLQASLPGVAPRRLPC